MKQDTFDIIIITAENNCNTITLQCNNVFYEFWFQKWPKSLKAALKEDSKLKLIRTERQMDSTDAQQHEDKKIRFFNCTEQHNKQQLNPQQQWREDTEMLVF